jgi:hypothetical protein
MRRPVVVVQRHLLQCAARARVPPDPVYERLLSESWLLPGKRIDSFHANDHAPHPASAPGRAARGRPDADAAVPIAVDSRPPGLCRCSTKNRAPVRGLTRRRLHDSRGWPAAAGGQLRGVDVPPSSTGCRPRTAGRGPSLPTWQTNDIARTPEGRLVVLFARRRDDSERSGDDRRR